MLYKKLFIFLFLIFGTNLVLADHAQRHQIIVDQQHIKITVKYLLMLYQ